MLELELNWIKKIIWIFKQNFIIKEKTLKILCKKKF